MHTIRIEQGKANALDVELCRRLTAQLREAEGERAVVLTGTGSIFSAGVDLVRMTAGGAAYVREFVPALVEMVEALVAFPRPLVAAINGHAIAGGCVLAAGCDARVMAAGEGRIGMPELQVGVPMPSIVVELMRFALPSPVLQEMLLRGTLFRPDDALRKGVVDEVVPAEELEARATAIAEQLAAVDADNFTLTKRQLRGEILTRARALAEAHDAAIQAQWEKPETHANIRAYLARTVGRKNKS
jgi:enoyl-CoA hydratase